MKIFPDKLEAQLKNTLLPIYFFSGDEPLQLNEAADAVRRHAREQGFTEREVMHVEKGFDWNELLMASNAPCLRASRARMVVPHWWNMRSARRKTQCC